MTPFPRSITSDLVAGGVTALWYALPDVMDRRRDRLFMKVGLLVGAGAYAFHQARKEQHCTETSEPSFDNRLVGESTTTATSTTMTPVPTPIRGYIAVFVAVLAVALLLVVAVTGASKAERAIFGFGENLAQRGVSWPHTRIGLVLGFITAVFSLGTPHGPPSSTSPVVSETATVARQ